MVPSSTFFLKESDYNWDKALLWGNSIGHFKRCLSGSLGERVVHLIIAIAEALPIIGQIVSIFETAIYKFLFYRSQEKANLLIQAVKITDEGIVHYNQRDFPKAVELFIKALEINKNVYGKKDYRIINNLADLGNAYYQEGDSSKTIKCLARTLKIIEEDISEGHQRNFSKVIESFIRTLESRGNLYGKEDPRILNSLQILERDYYCRKDFSKAIECSFKALEIKEKRGVSVGIVDDLLHLASAYREQGKIEKAIEFFNRALKIEENDHEKEDSWILSTLVDLGNAYCKQKKFSKAIETFDRALKIKEDAYGKESSLLIHDLVRIGDTYCKEKEFSKAIEFFSRALKIEENAYGEENICVVDSLLSLGNSYSRQNDFPKAIELFSRALKIRENAYGEEASRVVDSLVSLGDAYYHQHDFSKANDFFTKALKIRENAYGKESPWIVDRLVDLGNVYHHQNDFSKAIELFNRALEISKSSYEKEDRRTLANAYQKQGGIEKAIEMLTQKLENMKKLSRDSSQ